MFTNTNSQPHGIYIPNYPPPPLPSVSTQNALSLKNRVDTFRERIAHYLANRKKIIQNTHETDTQIANEKLKLCDVTEEIRHCYELMDEIKLESASLLTESTCMSENEWTEKISMLREKQTQMMHLTEKYINPDIQTAIEIKLTRRQQKRLRIKKRKKETYELRQLRNQIRQEKHRLIDDWFQETAKTIGKQREQAEEVRRVEQILWDVKRKKADAIKNIHLMESLIELHRVRCIQKSLNVRCERELVDELSMLKSQWHLTLSTYEEEEQKLRNVMKSNDFSDMWRKVLFCANNEISHQDNVHPINDMDDLIRIRRAWDACTVSQSNLSGSSIPIGWITPNVTPLAEWATYQIPQ